MPGIHAGHAREFMMHCSSELHRQGGCRTGDKGCEVCIRDTEWTQVTSSVERKDRHPSCQIVCMLS